MRPEKRVALRRHLGLENSACRQAAPHHIKTLLRALHEQPPNDSKSREASSMFLEILIPTSSSLDNYEGSVTDRKRLVLWILDKDRSIVPEHCPTGIKTVHLLRTEDCVWKLYSAERQEVKCRRKLDIRKPRIRQLMFDLVYPEHHRTLSLSSTKRLQQARAGSIDSRADSQMQTTEEEEHCCEALAALDFSESST